MYVHFLRSGKRGDDENEGEQFSRSRKHIYRHPRAEIRADIRDDTLREQTCRGVWERVKPIIQQRRERFVSQEFLAHVEHAACRFEPGWIRVRRAVSPLCVNVGANARSVRKSGIGEDLIFEFND